MQSQEEYSAPEKAQLQIVANGRLKAIADDGIAFNNNRANSTAPDGSPIQLFLDISYARDKIVNIKG